MVQLKPVYDLGYINFKYWKKILSEKILSEIF